MQKNAKSPAARPVKVGGYSSAALKSKRSLRQFQANQRQEKYDSLTTKEKIDRAVNRRGQSNRELHRLHRAYALET